ncbi:MAG: DUF2752 domain-containing protein, partial [Sphingobacteriales bacterium]
GTNNKKTIHITAVALAITAICIVYFTFDPAKYNFFPKCPFHMLTGLDCPGCGSQRAVHSLFHGELEKAVNYNLLLVMSLPFLAVHAGYKTASAVKNKKLQWPILYHRFTPKVIFAVVIIFWIVRNTPVYPLGN